METGLYHISHYQKEFIPVPYVTDNYFSWGECIAMIPSLIQLVYQATELKEMALKINCSNKEESELFTKCCDAFEVNIIKMNEKLKQYN